MTAEELAKLVAAGAAVAAALGGGYVARGPSPEAVDWRTEAAGQAGLVAYLERELAECRQGGRDAE